MIDAVVFGMIDIRELRRLRRVKPFDSGWRSRPFVGCCGGRAAGVVVGVVLSLR